MNSKTKTMLLLALLFSIRMASGQEIMGKDFWVTFIPSFLSSYPNWDWSHPGYDDHYYLLATSSKSCTGTVTNPNTGWNDTFVVLPDQTCIIDVPFEEAFPRPGQVNDIGIHVRTSDTISLYAYTSYTYSRLIQCEATLVIPTNKLRDEYIVQTAPAIAYDKAVLAVLAVENGTVVDIVTTCNAADSGPQANTPFSVTLNAGQCYYFKTRDGQHIRKDFTGSHIKARDGKRIAVTSGNLMQCNYNNLDQHLEMVDMLMEQMPPVQCAGKTFVVAGGLDQKQDSVRVTALHDGCVVFKNGVAKDTLQSGETFRYRIPYATEADLITTSQPALVSLCNIYRAIDGTETQRGMVVIDPLEQGVRKAVFTTMTDPTVTFHYLNITLQTAYKYTMTMDGKSITSKFLPLPHNNGYSYAKIKIQQGQHTLANSAGPFVAQAYGGRKQGNERFEYTGYAYSVGSMVHDLSAQIIADGFYSTDFPQGLFFCEDDTPVFHLLANFPVSHAEWDFGDGDTATGDNIPHRFPAPGTYHVSCNAYTLSNGIDSLAASLHTTIHIQQPVETNEWKTVCDAYDWNGLHCDTPGLHNVTLQTIGGCDSLVNLHLTLNHSDTVYYNATACDNYLWHDSLYTKSGNYFHFEGANIVGCDSIAVLRLQVKHDPAFHVVGITQVAFGSDIWPGVYRYYVVDSTLLEGTLSWECSNPKWEVKPLSDFSCMVFVRTSGQATLTAISAGCHSTASIVLNATPFGVEDGPDQNVLVFPNPASKKVTISAPELAKVEVYNLLGQQAASVEDHDHEPISINLEGLPQGVYIVTIHAKNGKTTKKLIVH